MNTITGIPISDIPTDDSPIDDIPVTTTESKNKFSNFIDVPNHRFFDCKDGKSEQSINTQNIYEILELLTKNLIELIIKTNINGTGKYGEILQNPVQNYYILGGKAINRIVNQSYLDNSFDFDIHLYSRDRHVITTDFEFKYDFGNHIISNINDFLNRENTKIYRFFLYQILLEHNFITPAQKPHYLNAQLFYIGERTKKRKHSEIRIFSLFIHFKLRPNIISDFGTNNMSNYPEGFNVDDGTGPSIDLFYPISDISSDDDGSFSLPINTEQDIIIASDGLHYASYVYVLYNLIKYVAFKNTNKNPKQEKNFNKLLKLSDINNYSCSFIMSYPPKIFYNAINEAKFSRNTTIMYNSKIIPDGVTVPYSLIINGINIYNPDMPMWEAIQMYYITYTRFYNKLNSLCTKNIILHEYPNTNNITKDKIFNDDFEYKSFLGLLEFMTYNADTERYLLLYTTPANILIKTYLQYKYFEYDISKIEYGEYPVYHDGKLLLSQFPRIDTAVNINPTTIENICNKISETFKNMRDDKKQYNYMTTNLKNNFNVYRLASFFSYKTSKTQLFNSSIICKKGIMYIPYFQSTSYSNAYRFDTFLNEMSILLEISISKNFNKWAMLNSYSGSSSECEILLDKDIFYYITNYKYIPIRKNNIYMEIPMLNVIAFNNFNDVSAYAATQILDFTGGNKEYNNDFNCINMSSKPEMINDIKKIVKNKNIIDFGNIYEIPDNELTKLDNPIEYAQIYAKYINMVVQSEKNKTKSMPALRSQLQNFDIKDFMNKQIVPKKFPEIMKKSHVLPKIYTPSAIAAAGGSGLNNNSSNENEKYYEKYMKYKNLYLNSKYFM